MELWNINYMQLLLNTILLLVEVKLLHLIDIYCIVNIQFVLVFIKQ